MEIAAKFLLEALVIGVIPCLYGCATRLPFIYFVIHLSQHFLLQWGTIGLCVGAYQACRVVSSSLAIFAPKFSHFLGTSAGLAGFTLVYFSDNNLIAPFVAGTVIVGLSETMSSMQKYAREIYKLDIDREKVQLMLKFQYASVMIGVVFAFSIGGIVYQRYSINGVALFGMIVEGFGLLACLAYFFFFKDPANIMKSVCLAHKEYDKQKNQVKIDIIKEKGNVKKDTSPQESPKNEQLRRQTKLDITINEGDEENLSSAQELQNDSLVKENGTKLDIDVTISSLLTSINAEYNTNEDICATWVNWLICMSFGVEAITIGYNLIIGPIFLLTQFEQDTGVIGVLFAVGHAFGTIVAIGATCTNIGSSAMKKIAMAPFDLCFAMFGIAIGVFVAAVPIFPVHVVGLILLMSFNDLGSTLMTELQGSITTVKTYSLLGPFGQVVRRSFNVVTALSGPLLFGVDPRLPYFVAGVVTLVWSVGITIAFGIRLDDTATKIERKLGLDKDSVMFEMDFSTREVAKSCLRNSVHCKTNKTCAAAYDDK